MPPAWPALGGWSLNDWITREVQRIPYSLKSTSFREGLHLLNPLLLRISELNPPRSNSPHPQCLGSCSPSSAAP